MQIFFVKKVARNPFKTMEIEVEFLEVNMCVICLSEQPDLIEVKFDESEETQNIGQVLMRHFWFQQEELLYRYVCEDCWQHVQQFHIFYLSIEKTHAEMKLSSHRDKLFYNSKTECGSMSPENSDIINQNTDTVCDEQILNDNETVNLEEIYIKNESLDAAVEVGTRKNESEDEDESAEISNKSNEDQCNDKLSKMFHKPIEVIVEEDIKISQHCKLECEQCKSSFPDFIHFKRHFREVHRTKGHVICCNRKFHKRIELVEHVTKHINPEAFKCTICNKTYCNSAGLSLHMIKHGAPGALTFKCDKCERSFAKKFQLNAHQLQHVAEEDKKCVCSVCNKAFANKYSLQHHIDRVHLRQFKFVCDICGKILNSRQTWKSHRLTHSEVLPLNKIQCSQCGTCYASMALLNVHSKQKHETAEKFICDVCAKSFKVKAQFEKHRKEHDESYQEVRLQCKICSKWMKNASSLRKHVLRHDGEGGTHECTICGKRAPNVLALQSHISFVHKKEKMYQCNLCSKAFKRHFSLMEHMTTHTGEVLYQCPFCLKPFNSSANMHAHKKKMHPVEWKESKRKSDLAFCGNVGSES